MIKNHETETPRTFPSSSEEMEDEVKGDQLGRHPEVHAGVLDRGAFKVKVSTPLSMLSLRTQIRLGHPLRAVLRSMGLASLSRGLLAVGSWTTTLTSTHLGFLSCKVEVSVDPQRIVKRILKGTHEAPRAEPGSSSFLGKPRLVSPPRFLPSLMPLQTSNHPQDLASVLAPPVTAEGSPPGCRGWWQLQTTPSEFS